MPLLDFNAAPSSKNLRWFAGVWWPLICGAAGVTLIRRFHMPETAIGLWIAGVILAIAGLISPPVIRVVYCAALVLTYPIGFVFSYVVLFAAYFLIFTPIGAAVRFFHDPMNRKLDRAATSYWLTHQPNSVDRYFRQF